MFKQEFNGYKDGKLKVLIVSGIHGNELTSIYAVMRLSHLLDKMVMHNNKDIGKITVMNFANQEAISCKQRSYAFFDLNRDFCIDRKAENKITVEIQEEIKKHDIIIDVHCYGSKHLTKNIVLINNNAQAKTYVDFCLRYEISFALQAQYQNSLKQYAIDLGKKAFTVELAGGLNKIDKDKVYSGCDLILKIINNFNPELFPSNNKKYDDACCLIDIMATNTGIFIDNQILDANEKVLASYTAYEKKIIFTTTHDFITRGDYVLSIQPRIYNEEHDKPV